MIPGALLTYELKSQKPFAETTQILEKAFSKRFKKPIVLMASRLEKSAAEAAGGGGGG